MTWWHYLLLVNLYLLLFFGFYALLLRRETFFQLNRLYLIGTAMLAVTLPVVQVQWITQWFVTEQVRQTIYQVSPQWVLLIRPRQQQSGITAGQLLAGAYLAGVVLLSARLLWRLVMVKRLLQQQPQKADAWSFFKTVKVDSNLPNPAAVIAHEQVHARQWHSADLLLMEVLTIINWFNPIAYLYRRAIQYVHEYIADSEAIRQGNSKSDYARLLLGQTFSVPAHSLANTFFKSSMLRQRILMLQKAKSHRVALLKYAFLAPLFVLMLTLSAATVRNSSIIKAVQHKVERALDGPVPVVSQPLASPVAAPRAVVKRSSKAATPKPEPAGEQLQVITPANTIDAANEVFTSVEQVPEFEGGMEKFYRYMGQHIRYPKLAYDSNVQGRAIITFVVEKDGSLSNIHSLRDPGAGLGDEAVRVMAQSPRWLPGRQNGKTVRVQFTVPVLFTLQSTDEAKPDTAKTPVAH